MPTVLVSEEDQRPNCGGCSLSKFRRELRDRPSPNSRAWGTLRGKEYDCKIEDEILNEEINRFDKYEFPCRYSPEYKGEEGG